MSGPSIKTAKKQSNLWVKAKILFLAGRMKVKKIVLHDLNLKYFLHRDTLFLA
jgi:hypothetical protein